MAVEHDADKEDVTLGNGDSLAERLAEVDLDEDETCSTEELRERLDL